MGMVLAVATAGLTVGCGPRHHTQGSVVQPSSTGVELDAVLVQEDGESVEATLDRVLHTGDRVGLKVHVPQPAYLYAVNLAPGGKGHVAWPSDAPREVEGEVYIPDGSWFELAAPAGPEVIALVATYHRIPLNERGVEFLVQLAHEESQRSDLVKLQAAHAPGYVASGHATVGVRGRALTPGRGLSARMRMPGDHAILLIDLDHRAD